MVFDFFKKRASIVAIIAILIAAAAVLTTNKIITIETLNTTLQIIQSTLINSNNPKLIEIGYNAKTQIEFSKNLLFLNIALIFVIFSAVGYFTISILERHRKAAATIEIINQKHIAVLETAVDGMIIIDSKGIVQTFNLASQKMFGYSADEVIGKNIKMLMPTSYRNEHDSYLSNYHATHERKIIGIGREVMGQRKDGSVFPLELSVGEATHAGESLFVGVLRDITSRKQNEEALKASNAELERFAYIASHDLSEPLRTVSSYSQLILKRYGNKLDESGRDFIDYILGGTVRMQQLLSGLLEFSRVTTRAKQPTKVNCQEMAQQVIRDLELAILDSNADIIIAKELPEINIYDLHFRQLLQNLIANAIKFKKKDVNPQVIINYDVKDRCYQFSIADNGIGISEQYYDRIFEIFRRLHTQDQYEGTGTGLAICKKIANFYGGTIWVESVEGKGSTFYFTIPTTVTGEQNESSND
jgi:PAS domain S-box-containing protein